MATLIDSNILLRSAQPTHPMHSIAVAATRALFHRDEMLCVVRQIMAEFWTVVTRPESQNGLGFSIAEAQQELENIEATFTVLPDVPPIYAEWKRLVLQFGVQVSGLMTRELSLP